MVLCLQLMLTGDWCSLHHTPLVYGGAYESTLHADKSQISEVLLVQFGNDDVESLMFYMYDVCNEIIIRQATFGNA